MRPFLALCNSLHSQRCRTWGPPETNFQLILVHQTASAVQPPALSCKLGGPGCNSTYTQTSTATLTTLLKFTAKPRELNVSGEMPRMDWCTRGYILTFSACPVQGVAEEQRETPNNDPDASFSPQIHDGGMRQYKKIENMTKKRR